MNVTKTRYTIYVTLAPIRSPAIDFFSNTKIPDL